MAQTKIRGNQQVLAGSLTTTQLSASAAIILTQLAVGSDVILRTGTVAMTGDLALGTHKITGLAVVTDANADTDAASVKYVKDRTGAIASGLAYKGVFDASLGVLPSNTKLGDLWKVSVGGTAGTVVCTIGDILICNTANAGQSISIEWDRIDAIESVNSVAGRVGNVTLTIADIGSVTASAAEVNYLVGVTSLVQTQLGGKINTTALSTATDMGGLNPLDTKIPSQAAVKSYVDGKVSGMGTACVDGEIVSGACNDINCTFTIAYEPVVGSVHLYINGQRLRSGTGNDYTILSATITTLFAPTAGDLLLADYRKP